MAGAIAVGLAAASANAAITAVWVQNTITPGAFTDSQAPVPAGAQSWDLVVTITGGDDWISGRLYSDSSTFYNHPFGANNGPPNSALFPAFPGLEFDTYVRSPSGNPGDALILGGSTPDGQGDTPTAIFSSSTVSVFWGDLVNTGDGTFSVARITFSGAVPTFTGKLFSAQNNINGIPMPQIPEPGTAALALGAMGLLLARRRSA
jgi:hypothetical protein